MQRCGIHVHQGISKTLSKTEFHEYCMLAIEKGNEYEMAFGAKGKAPMSRSTLVLFFFLLQVPFSKFLLTLITQSHNIWLDHLRTHCPSLLHSPCHRPNHPTRRRVRSNQTNPTKRNIQPLSSRGLEPLTSPDIPATFLLLKGKGYRHPM